jgi:Rrf2 family protein
MSEILKISEAAVLAFHAMVAIAAQEDGIVTNAEIASAIQASEAHLAKVMQRLVKAGFIKSVRGPHGGFVLGKDASEIFLKDIYELFEGSLEFKSCLLEKPVCGNNCIFGELMIRVNEIVHDFMINKRLKDVIGKTERKVIVK